MNMQDVPGKVKRIACILCISVLAPWFSRADNAAAQGFTFWNPANPALPYATEINPALLSAHFTQVAIGLKVYHLGFLESSQFGLRESRFNLSLPYLLPMDFALGLDVRHFGAQIYSELVASLLLAKRITGNFAVGAKIALERRGFDTAQFQGVDFSDPLIAGGLQFNRLNLGFGAYWQNDLLVAGIGLDHVNKPDIGLADADAIVPLEISGALGLRLGQFVPTLLLHDDGTEMRIGFALSLERPALGALRFGYESEMPFKIEASLNLSRNSKLGYGLDLPGKGTRGASAGTQELVYQQILGREPELGQPELLFSTRRLRIIEKTVIRTLPADIRARDVESIDEILPGYLSSGRSTDDLMIVVAGPLSSYETDSIRQARYQRIAAQVEAACKRQPGMKLYLRADAATVADAKQLKAYIVRHSPIAAAQVRLAKIAGHGPVKLRGFISGKRTISKMKPVLSTPVLVLQLAVPGRARKTRNWKLIVRDAGGKTVKTFRGTKTLPERIEWDWRDDHGRLLRPGTYVFLLGARTTFGNIRRAKSEPVQVSLIRRKVILKFTRKPETLTSRVPGALQNTAAREE